MRARFAALVLLSAACGSVQKRDALPQALSGRAEIPGIPNARFWGDAPPPDIVHWRRKGRKEVRRHFAGVVGIEHQYLALSGGGADGAFGAGLLLGWTAAGTRPEFELVTGVSTGALIAPFAFLGPDYDPILREAFTQLSTKDLVEERSLLATITGDSAASSEPMRKRIASYIDEQALARIAAEHRKGRRLFLGTTDLDAERPVTWNMGAIAASGAPGALELFRTVMLASASIPVAFPPVLIGVEAEGQRYDEVHVDGGVTRQVFLLPVTLDWREIEEDLEVRGAPKLYVIRNSKLAPVWKRVNPGVMDLATRSIESLIRTQGIGDLYRIYVEAERDRLDFRLAYIPADFEVESNQLFDPVYMGALFDLAYERAKAGYSWSTSPVGAGAD
ncbi:MAG: patatin-like phospholipase family protein [Planctomycetota bacterium]